VQYSLCHENVHSARQRRSVSSTSNDSVSGCISTPNPASSLLHNGTNPQIDIANDEHTSNDDGNDANVPVSNEGSATTTMYAQLTVSHPAVSTAVRLHMADKMETERSRRMELVLTREPARERLRRFDTQNSATPHPLRRE